MDPIFDPGSQGESSADDMTPPVRTRWRDVVPPTPSVIEYAPPALSEEEKEKPAE